MMFILYKKVALLITNAKIETQQHDINLLTNLNIRNCFELIKKE